jgi:hypothetical protein
LYVLFFFTKWGSFFYSIFLAIKEWETIKQVTETMLFPTTRLSSCWEEGCCLLSGQVVTD